MKKTRNGTIDFLKFLFSVIIVLFHPHIMIDDAKFFDGGYIFVEFFFIVSGYYMMLSYSKKEHNISIASDTFEYLRNKMINLMPNLIISAFIGYVVWHRNELSLFNFASNFSRDIFWKVLFLQQTGLGKDYDVTWYLSAMLISMLLVYPCIRLFKENFYLIAVILILFLMGYMYKTCGHFDFVWGYRVFYYNGMYRGLNGILTGCICFAISEKLSKIKFTKFMYVLFTAIECAIYTFVLVFVYKRGHSLWDFFIFVLLTIAIIISTSQVSYSKNVFNHKIFMWLGEYSYSLFLGHIFWRDYFSPLSIGYRLCMYVLTSLVTGLIIMYLTKFLRYLWKKNKALIKKIVIE